MLADARKLKGDALGACTVGGKRVLECYRKRAGRRD
jgi:hypothetical protein